MLTQVHQNKKEKKKREGESGIIAVAHSETTTGFYCNRESREKRWRVTQN